jgi:hypothetical protein
MNKRKKSSPITPQLQLRDAKPILLCRQYSIWMMYWYSTVHAMKCLVVFLPVVVARWSLDLFGYCDDGGAHFSSLLLLSVISSQPCMSVSAVS